MIKDLIFRQIEEDKLGTHEVFPPHVSKATTQLRSLSLKKNMQKIFLKKFNDLDYNPL